MRPLLLDSRTARHMLGGIGKTKFYQLCRDGVLVRVKIGRKTGVTYESVEACAKGNV